MTYLASFKASSAGLTLRARWIGPTGTELGSEISSGIVDVGGGWYTIATTEPSVGPFLKIYRATGEIEAVVTAELTLNRIEVESLSGDAVVIAAGGVSGIGVKVAGMSNGLKVTGGALSTSVSLGSIATGKIGIYAATGPALQVTADSGNPIVIDGDSSEDAIAVSGSVAAAAALSVLSQQALNVNVEIKEEG